MTTFYISPRGNDKWSGKIRTPNSSRSDGPFATFAAAQRTIRQLKGRKGLSEPVTVYVRGGEYILDAPLAFAARDSGTPSHPVKDPKNAWAQTPDFPITYAAYENEEPIFSGGRRLTGWKETILNGRTVWVARVPQPKSGRWRFSQLWVNGTRAERPVSPRKGFHRVEKPVGKPSAHFGWFGGHKAFIAAPGDIRPWRNLPDVEVVVYNYWICSRMRIESFDPATRLAELDRHCKTHLIDEWGKQGACYRVEGALEMLSRPGEWCMDSRRGLVYYVPRAGERLAKADIVAPWLPQVMRIEGQDADKKPAELLRFEGITFAHSEWEPAPDYSGSGQAACDVPGAVVLKNARQIAFDRCAFTHLGSYALECETGCCDVRVQGCDITDLAGGGVKVWHGNSRITIADSEIAHGGRLFGQACGVLVGQSSGMMVVHNHIHDFHYTGISLGWRWGYLQGNAYGNVVEYNHVHDLGHGLLSDMGCIYTLGPQPGTRIRYNLFHDVDSRTYGGWAMYTDEGSTDILIENNIAYGTKCGGFHQHYGRDNIVRNNILAFSRENQLARTRPESHNSFTFERNIVLIDQGVFWKGNWSGAGAVLRGNVYWDMRFGRRAPAPPRLWIAGEGDGRISLAKWRAMGLDVSSIVVDPLFVDPRKGDFRLRRGSPALRRGFIPFDLSDVGPRAESRRMKRR